MLEMLGVRRGVMLGLCLLQGAVGSQLVQEEVTPLPTAVRTWSFDPPPGLTRPADVLLRELGFLDWCSPSTSVPYTYRFCMDVAIKCHAQGRYLDSYAFSKRAAEIYQSWGALYLRGLNELALNMGEAPAVTALQLKAVPPARSEHFWLREKFAGPLAVRLKMLLELP